MENTRLKLEEINNIHHPKVSILFATASKQLPDLLLYLKQRNPQTQYQIHQWQKDKEFDDADIQILSCTNTENLSETDVILLKEKILLAFVPTLSWDNLGNNIVLREIEGIHLNRIIYLRTKPFRYLTHEQKECIEGIKEYFNMKYSHK